MKNKITLKLISYFLAVLLLFSVVVGLLFTSLFANYTIAHHEDDLKFKAVHMSKSLSSYLTGSVNMNTGVSYTEYLKLLDGLVAGEIWIVDKSEHTISVGEGTEPFQYNDLPSEVEQMIEQVLQGSLMRSREFSSLLKKPNITIGSPIFDQDGNVIAAVLLHSSIEGTQTVIAEGFKLLLVASLIAMLLSVLSAVLLSMHFNRPIRAMQIAANHMADGDYKITTKVSRRDELGALANDIDILAQQLDAASRESSRLEQMRHSFVSNVSHELRTPVTVLRSSLEALCDGMVHDPAAVKAFHNRMLAETLQLQRMITDLLELSRLQNIEFTFSMAEIDLDDVVSDALGAAIHLAKNTGIVLDYKPNTASHPILGDYGRLRQLVLILLDNAIKFSPNDGQVSLVVKVEKEGTVLSVKDQGKGIREEDLPFVFERFYKGDDSSDPHSAGLGLCIAQQIALRHGAAISVRNLPEGGCQFDVQFKSVS